MTSETRWLPALPLIALLLGAAVFVLGGAVIDASGLDNEQVRVFGYGVAALLLSMTFGLPVVIVLTVIAVAGMAGPPGTRARWAQAGSWVLVALSAALAWLALDSMSSGEPSDTAFAGVLAVVIVGFAAVAVWIRRLGRGPESP